MHDGGRREVRALAHAFEERATRFLMRVGREAGWLNISACCTDQTRVCALVGFRCDACCWRTTTAKPLLGMADLSAPPSSTALRPLPEETEHCLSERVMLTGVLFLAYLVSTAERCCKGSAGSLWLLHRKQAREHFSVRWNAQVGGMETWRPGPGRIGRVR